MKKRLIIFNVTVTTLALVLMFVAGLFITRKNNNEQAERNLINLAQVYAETYSGNAQLVEIDQNIRVTIVAADGKVVADSKQVDVSALENHLQRQEIQSALAGKSSIARRYSATLGADMMYYALKVPTADSFVFVRVAMPVATINDFATQTIPYTILIMAVAIGLTVVVSIVFGRYSIKPLATVRNSLQAINDAEFKPIIATSKDKEVNQILVEISAISEKVQQNLCEQIEQEEKLDYILDNISDGVVVVNPQGIVQLINGKARHIFDVTNSIVGKTANCLTFDQAFTDNLFASVTKGQNTLFESQLNKSIYLCSAKYMSDDSKMTILVMTDITVTRNNEKLRSEFFANASHELKTPLTSIKGFNELVQLSNGDKKLDPYIAQIAKESNRMLTLIDDMLRLSNLENKVELEKSKVDVASVAQDVISTLQPLAKEKNITVATSGQGSVFAEQEHIYDLVKNLVENAIKYNNVGGKVDVKIAEGRNNLTIEVSDNGIGIDSKHQARIFERFYRVEKSRSRETGGTGLGLAIVKHIAELYKAELSIKSKVGVGTVIKVVFNTQSILQ
ncbi:MAG: ATP-binding protein [Clostridia bacterium]